VLQDCSKLRGRLRQQIRRAKPIVVVLMLCSRIEAERYREGAEAFIDQPVLPGGDRGLPTVPADGRFRLADRDAATLPHRAIPRDHVEIGGSWPLAEAGEAHRALAERRTTGSLLLSV
jgi:hypothetical protein